MEAFVVFFSMIPMIIGLVLAVYLLKLLARFVAAIEKIADKFENKQDQT